MTSEAKKQILNTWNAIEKIRRVLEQNAVRYVGAENPEFIDLLEQYQASVVMVGETLERIFADAERTELIHAMEQYCEEIYMISECVMHTEDYRKQLIKVRELHRELENKIKSIKVRKLALFLPYKFSMWDSLESIYLAAEADPEWDVVVMPIPYQEFDDNQKGNWYYEGPEYYKGFNVYSYKEYDISEQRPDVIYIHNPYDECNRVTSVASDFYSYNLRKYCKKIVYVPYFFTNSEFPGIHRDLATYERFDYVIVPSEKARGQVAEFFPGDKVQALGSPKIDRMLSMEKNYVLPKEWEERIRGRKTVLYNVGLTSLLQNGFQVILKMHYIFNYFKKNQDIVLWWRPHPLLKSSLKSMLPNLYGAYEALERIFLLDNIGIYDLTPDSNRAIAATDAFLGDYSSMSALYGIVGKPVFFTETLSLEEPTKEDRHKFNLMYPGCDAIGYVKVDEQYLFYAPSYRALCSLDITDLKVSILKIFEDNYFRMQAFHASDPAKTEIYLFPVDRDHDVIVYSLADGQIRVAGEYAGIPLQKYGNILRMTDEKWLVAPRENTEAMIIAPSEGDVKTSNNVDAEFHADSMLTGDPLLSGASVVIEKKLYTLAYKSEKMMVTNLESMHSEVITIGNKGYDYSSFVYFKNKFWLLEWNGKCIACWDPVSRNISYYEAFPENFRAMNSTLVTPYTPAFQCAIIYKEELIILPFMANMILRFNMQTGCIERYNIKLPYEEGQRKASYYNDRSNYLGLLVYDESHVLIQTSFDKSVIKLNLENGETEVGSILIPEDVYEQNQVSVAAMASRDRNQSPYFIREKGLDCSLNDMMQFLLTLEGWDAERQHAASTEGIENADGTCGQKIHAFVKEKIGS